MIDLPSPRSLQAAPILDYLETQMPDYPFQAELDRDFVEELLDDFGELDVLEQIKRFRWFHNGKPPNEKPRLALRKWFSPPPRWGRS
ncbi:MAG TPA: hypothetical protein VNB06_16745 [Thermoanaerobaculia bacterium]|nr:hypothetical protein [Thermoanaerobaculia bacterium]